MMFMMLFYLASVVISFKLGGHLTKHPEASAEWIETFWKWLNR